MSNEAISDDIGPLGPKDFQIDTEALVRKIKTAPAPNIALRDRNGVVIKTKPDITVPEAETLKAEKLFPVRMVKGYRPFTEHFEIGEENPETGEITYSKPTPVLPGQDAGFMHQLQPGEPAKLPISEAREVIKRGIAERNDELAA